MAQNNITMTMVAELDFGCVEKEEQKCGACRERFKCWTTRSFHLSISHLTVSKSLDDMRDKFEFKAELPKCFIGSNMVGSKVAVRADIKGTFEVFNGVITDQCMKVGSAVGSVPTITIQGIKEWSWV